MPEQPLQESPARPTGGTALFGSLYRTVSLLDQLRRAVVLDRLAYDPGGLRRYQDMQVARLVRHAAARVPFYREKYRAAGIDPDSIRTADDLAHLPLTSRADLRAAFPHGLIPDGTSPDNQFLVETTGSTGEPVRLFKDWPALCAIAAWSSPVMLRRWWGVWGLRLMTLLLRQEHSVEEAVVAALPRFLLRVHAGDALASPEEHLEDIRRRRPDIIVTYPTVLKTLATRIVEDGARIPQPRLLATSAEMLDVHARRLIGQAFTGRLVNLYASTEAGFIAVECLAGRGLHVNSPRVIVEVLQDGRPAPPGEPGDVVVTDLTSVGCPIIRYQGLGDVARWSPDPCPCGRSFPLLDVVEGRRIDAFVLPDGRVLHPFTLSHAMVHFTGIRRFQIVQEAIDRVRVLIVPNGQAGADLGGLVAAEFARLLGRGVHVTVDLVDAIPAPPNAHFPSTVRSLVSRPHPLD
ncbi:MAG: phenylacetate--CoA ligase family protein [Armatimonadetes bacterium]|nr:phenylacetate--CoA ligase family protein [Armatimonadota bacterium]